MSEAIRIRGARTHNLRNVSLDLPRGRLVVVTGPSGSGKSSLAFDTLFIEGQRRFLASLPSLPKAWTLPKPDVDAVEGLPPVLSLSQSAGAPRPRSTLATLTEIHDHLRLLWARVGVQHCPDCDVPIRQTTLAEIAREILALPVGRKLFLLAPLVKDAVGDHRAVFQKIRQGGFLRARINGVLYEIRDIPTLDPAKPHTIDLVVDRLVVRPGIEDRLHESLVSAVKQGDGCVVTSDVEETGDWNDVAYQTRLACTRCGGVVPDLDPRRFHFNSPQGACSECGGLGVTLDAGEEGRDAPCPACGGARLNRASRAVRYAGATLPETTRLTVSEALARAQAWEEATRAEAPALAKAEAILTAEVRARLAFLVEVGLDYLTLDRPSATLSGGELQRARLATQLGGGLRGVCYVLDEPTLGLHPRDTERLLAALRRLRDRGNSLIVVEHDDAVMRAADHLVDLGPGAGRDGGRLLAAGAPNVVAVAPESVTGPYLRGDAGPTVGADAVAPGEAALVVREARLRNLQGIDVSLPLGRLVVVAGASGSGKSTLVRDVLAPAVRAKLARSDAAPIGCRAVDGLDAIDRLVQVDQRALGRSMRSNAATYTGMFDEIRKLFALTRLAKIRGYKANRFSSNVRGGRCETCAGHGEVDAGGPLLAEASVPCPSCRGARYDPATLDVRFKGKSIAEVLALSVAEARDLFAAAPPVARILGALDAIGLGYLTLGQPAQRLSGGEAQRVKLAAELARGGTGRTLFLLDEPTAGLHRIDVARLMRVLRELTTSGNTVVVIEHHPDALAVADWIVELGPEAGPAGGRVVAAGSPADLARHPSSVTGRFLRT